VAKAIPTIASVAINADASLANQDDAGRLKSVFRIRFATQNISADAQDHGPVSAQQRLEGRLVASFRKLLEQGLVGQLPYALAFDDTVNQLHNRTRRSLAHLAPQRQNTRSTLLVPAEAEKSRIFF
jgi:hypothetical protein